MSNLNLEIMKMKALLLAAIFACGFIMVNAQDVTFEKGTKALNLGIGFGGNYYSGYGSGITKTPLLSIALDYGIMDGLINNKASIGVGGYFAYKGYKWESGYNYGWKSTNLIIGPRGTFHYALVDKLDTYAGLLLAYHVVTEKRTGDWGTTPYSSSGSEMYFSGFIGARYYFTKNLAAMLELGSGNLGAGNIGITLKF
jgi:hypothetical protein